MRGPFSLLRHQLTGQTAGCRTVVDFVTNLKAKLPLLGNRLHRVMDRPRGSPRATLTGKPNLELFKWGTKSWYSHPRRLISFMLNCLVQEGGVEGVVSDVTYRVSTPDRRKKSRLYHVNSLKPWTTPTAVLSVRYCGEGLDTLYDGDLQLYPFEQSGNDQPLLNKSLTAEQKKQLISLLKEKCSTIWYGTWTHYPG